MKELKFRAWNKKSKRWDNSNIYLDSNGTPWWIFGGELTGNDVDVDIQLFTGLKDKSGKEIYEGDVMKFPAEDTYEVEFDKGQYQLKRLNDERIAHRPPTSLWPTAIPGEVIGNIYENSELASLNEPKVSE